MLFLLFIHCPAREILRRDAVPRAMRVRMSRASKRRHYAKYCVKHDFSPETARSDEMKRRLILVGETETKNCRKHARAAQAGRSST
jgi:hypothetical protein